MAKPSKKRAKSTTRKRKNAARKGRGSKKTTARKKAAAARPKAQPKQGPEKKPAEEPARKPAAAAAKEADSGLLSKLKRAFISPQPAAEKPRRIIPATALPGEPDRDRFVALDPANRKRTKLPPKVERPSPLHLDQAPPRKVVDDSSPSSIRLENPVVEPLPAGKPVRLHPDDSESGEEPVKLTEAVVDRPVARTVSQSMRKGGGLHPVPTGQDPEDPFLSGIDEDLSPNEPGDSRR